MVARPQCTPLVRCSEAIALPQEVFALQDAAERPGRLGGQIVVR